MSPDRQQQLRASLEDRLEQQHPRATASTLARVRWLSEQLENYVERWLGFAALPDADLPSLVAGNLFGVVDVGAATLDAEIKALPAHTAIVERWTKLRHELQSIPQAKSKPNAEALRSTLRDFLATMPE